MLTDGDLPNSAHEGSWRRGFWGLIATQFQGAFNVNGLRSLAIFLILAVTHDQNDRENRELALGLLFSVPFILFSMTGGWLADRYSKRSVTIGTKVFEIAIMLVALYGLWRGDLRITLAAVFLTCTQAALFAPSKYGLLPELLPPDRLSWGNGVLELGTFLALIAGTVAAGPMASAFHGRQSISGAIFLACSVVGLVLSQTITRVPAADPAKKWRANFLGDLWSQGKKIRADRILYLAVAGNTYFWFLGTLL